MENVTLLVDSSNTDVRIVSIVGPPGIGKSTLAIQIGPRIERKTNVYYVDMGEVSSMQALAEKILESDKTLPQM